ncbi:hypothetical protein AWB78_07815 [Caballeronia calidae]|uniref:Uncharacterized protein n=1 Tax=Caballeronia calidae TaxID=1777139 RepID=A0A158EGH2_9BURK|nr:hypothetical protein [Caballeronia calidae]SAL05991.1 hypothetical protein AWB78_07815 [Caballeronia calidae]
MNSNQETFVPLITRRQREWNDAHERAEQSRTGDVFGWWIDMRCKGRLSASNTDINMRDELRLFNAQQVAPLPFDR